ncbi:hypothetical protein GCM10009853_012210 [Glycomyces scopariae]
MVDDGERVEVGLLDEARGLLLVGVGGDLVVLAGDELGDLGVGVGADEVGEGDGAEELAVPVGHREHVEVAGPLAQVPDALDRGGGAHRGAQRHVVGRHDAPGGLRVVAEELRGLAPVGGAELGLEAGRDLGGHLVEELGPVVGLHRLQDLAHEVGLEPVDELLLVDGVELLEDRERAVLGEQAEPERLVGQIHAGELFGELDGREVGEFEPERGEFVDCRGRNGLNGRSHASATS